MRPSFRTLSNAMALAATLLAAGCVDRITSPSDPPSVSFSILPGGTSVGELSVGGYHSCVLKTDGTVVCWGRNTSTQSTPPPGLIAVQLSAGQIHTCALKADGTVACWGDNSWGERTVPAGLVASQVAAGTYNTCVVRPDATVFCWGGNFHGENNVPAGLTSVARVIPALEHTCALKTDGTVVCWGNVINGQTDVPAGLVAVQVSGRWIHVCALQADGTPVCWGYPPFTAVPAGIVADQISAGGNHTCALRTDATVACWGFNDQGQTDVPPGLISVAQVGSGFQHTCALRTDGTVICWGLNDTGQTNVPGGLNSIATQSQAITFTSAPPVSPIVGGSYVVTATGGGSGNPLTFSTLTSITCSVTDATVAFLATGTCTIAADQAGSTNYFAAPQAIQSLTIEKAPQVVTFTSSPAEPAVLGGLYVVSANSSIGALVTFTTTGSCSNSGTTVQLTAIGSCSVTAHAAGDANYLDANGPTQTFAIVFAFAGFYSPVSNIPVTNTAKAGQTVPMKFSLSGDQGLSILAAGSPESININCSTIDPDGPFVAAEGPGLSELSYDVTTDQYNYKWKTEKSWAGTCRQFVLTLSDGTAHRANFWFVN